MLKKKEIRICLGSSCFSRGNKQILQIIQQYLKDHQLESDVNLKGSHCFNDCSAGPFLKFGQTLYEHVTHETVIEILEKELGDH